MQDLGLYRTELTSSPHFIFAWRRQIYFRKMQLVITDSITHKYLSHNKITFFFFLSASIYSLHYHFSQSSLTWRAVCWGCMCSPGTGWLWHVYPADAFAGSRGSTAHEGAASTRQGVTGGFHTPQHAANGSSLSSSLISLLLVYYNSFH